MVREIFSFIIYLVSDVLNSLKSNIYGMKMNVHFKTNCLNLKVCLEMTGNKAAKKRSQSGNCNLAIREVPRGTNRSAQFSGQNKK